MKLPNPFKHKPTLEELQAKNEYAEEELSFEKKQAMIDELKRRGGDWRLMSDNGKKSGINFGRILAWLKSH
jgi:hypothetical protein